MGTEYKVRLATRDGVLVSELVDFTNLAYTREVNAPGVAEVTLPGGHVAITLMGIGYQLEVWRRNRTYNLDWTRDFSGVIHEIERKADADGNRSAVVTAQGDMVFLNRAIVGYAAATTNRSKFTAAKAETIAKTLVTRNATSSGTTADGRVRNVDLTGITVQADGATGNTLDYACAWRNLLTALQDLAAVGGGDFDLIKTGAAAWEFRWYNGQRGVDRTATVAFALNLGNMTNPVLKTQSLNEFTVAIVGGQGTESSRTIVVRTGTNYQAGWNSVEKFVDARMNPTTDALNAAGDRALSEAQASYSLTFEVVQTPATVYGVHYNLGDLVTASFDEYSASKQVTGVSVAFTPEGETIQVTMKDVT